MRTSLFALLLVGLVWVLWEPHTIGQVENDYACYVGVGGTCANTGMNGCELHQEAGDCSGGCRFCLEDTSLGTKYCVYYKGKTCTKNGAFIPCGGTDNRYSGECDQDGPGSICHCTNVNLVGSCAEKDVDYGTWPCTP